MTELTITTNHKPRPLIQWHELTDAERAEFDWPGAEESSFFRYRGALYCLSDFQVAPPALEGWDGFSPDGFFCGVAVRIVSDCIEDAVIVALVTA